MKQAVIAPSMLALLYPLDGRGADYTREQFMEDLVNESEKDIRQAFDAGAERVSIDFTEGRLACRNDPRNPWTGRGMLPQFIDAQQPRARPFLGRGAHQDRHPHLPGGDCDSVTAPTSTTPNCSPACSRSTPAIS